MGKFTPGPWSISRCRCGDPICKKWVIDHSSSNGMYDEADARLISAAPEMYEALTACLSVMEARAPEFKMVNETVRALIKRIER